MGAYWNWINSGSRKCSRDSWKYWVMAFQYSKALSVAYYCYFLRFSNKYKILSMFLVYCSYTHFLALRLHMACHWDIFSKSSLPFPTKVLIWIIVSIQPKNIDTLKTKTNSLWHNLHHIVSNIYCEKKIKLIIKCIIYLHQTSIIPSSGS